MSKSIQAKHKHDLAALTRSKRGKGSLLLLGVLVLLLVGAITYVTSLDANPRDLYTAAKSNQTLRSFVYQAESLDRWLAKFAFGWEYTVYQFVKESVYKSVLEISGSKPGKLILGVHAASFQLVFFVISAWKLWLLCVIGVVLYRRRTLEPYSGDNFLAGAGNNRLYYSGIRVGLDSFNPDGTLKTQLRGLACPQLASPSEVEQSQLFKLCGHFDALNDTNADLIAIILKYADYPAYLPKGSSFVSLLDFAQYSLQVGLTLQQAFQSQSVETVSDETEASLSSELPALLNDIDAAEASDLVAALSSAFERVLLKEMKNVIAKVDPAELASFLLAASAGRVLVYSSSHGSWTSHSQYPQLSSRAILSSIPSLDTDYDHFARIRLRQSIIYAQRSTDFGPVRFPEAMGIDIQALRQWSELLFTDPDQLAQATNEVELYGLSWYYFWKFKAAFEKELTKSDSTLVHDILFTKTDVAFVPLSSLLPVLKSVTPKAVRKRLLELSEMVSSYHEARKRADQDEARPEYERVFVPLSEDECKELSEFHGIKERDLVEWGAFRALLNLYGTLVRKVGFSVVPEHSLVATVAIGIQGSANGRVGDIPIRLDQLVEKDRLGYINLNEHVAISTNLEAHEAILSRFGGTRTQTSQEVTNG